MGKRTRIISGEERTPNAQSMFEEFRDLPTDAIISIDICGSPSQLTDLMNPMQPISDAMLVSQIITQGFIDPDAIPAFQSISDWLNGLQEAEKELFHIYKRKIIFTINLKYALKISNDFQRSNH